MGLETILIEVLTTYLEIKTLDQLVNVVANHHEYHGKSKGEALKRQIIRILKDQQFKQQLHQSDRYITLKLGRFTGMIDLS